MDQRAELSSVVRAWLDRASVDPRTGLPPDAKVIVDPTRIGTFGSLKPGQTEPDNGWELWSIKVTFYFPEHSDTWDDPNDVGLAIAQLLDQLSESVANDPRIGTGNERLTVTWRGTEGNAPTQPLSAPEDYPEAVELHLGARFA